MRGAGLFFWLDNKVDEFAQEKINRIALYVGVIAIAYVIAQKKGFL